jgi:hypothetical protein
VHNSNLVNWTPIFEQNVVRCGSKNKHPKDMCVKGIGLCVHNMLTIQVSMVNVNGEGGHI